MNKGEKIFQEKIDLYESFIEKRKISPLSIPIYKKNINQFKKILKRFKEKKITPIFFKTLDSRLKWDVSKVLKGVEWLCENCKSSQGKQPPKRTWNEVCCTECDHTLTHRTGGGQSDPFNYTFKKS